MMDGSNDRNKQMIADYTTNPINSDIDNAVKLEQLRFISQTHRTLHENRRRLEWRVFSVTLSVYVLSALAALKGDFKVKLPQTADAGIWIAYILLAIITVLYTQKMHVANMINMRIAEKAEEKIDEIIGHDGSKQIINEFKSKIPNRFWSWHWQTVVTLLVAMVCALIITIAL